MRRIKYKKVRKVQPNFYEYNGIFNSEPVEMQLFVYNQEGYEEYNACSLDRIEKELRDPSQTQDVKWLNIHGLHDAQAIGKIGEFLDIEPIIIGDILNVTRRARMEEADNVLFFSIKSILAEDDLANLRVEQISFLLKDNLLVSFQEKRSDFFSHLRERIRSGSGIVRKRGSDYLLYLLLDAIIENFFVTLEAFEEDVEQLFMDAKHAENTFVLYRIEKSRERLNFLKKAVVPLRDALYNLKSVKDDEDYDGIEHATYTFFARLHQKCLEILDQIEYDTNTLESASNMFFSSQGQRMNQIMKTLTVFSVIFMPLTFIVGVYGMNFDNMPELRTEHGYYYVWGIMIVIAAIMVIYFRRKKWF